MNINEIHSPADLKNLSIGQLSEVAAQLREALIEKLVVHGGHVGPNLGVVEATVALHYAFDAPKDKLVFDVSHQSYVHKMLTGRIEAFTDPAKFNDVSGYTDPKESPEYDLFSMGHTSSSISLACGLARARDLSGGNENVVAFIGDASLGGGEALEGLDNGGTLRSNFIVVVNDNQMSIAENHGALYKHLTELRESDGRSSNNIFRNFGYDYIYVDRGNDMAALIDAFQSVKDSKRPVVVHINTLKGKGLPVAVEHKEAFHWHVPFDRVTGQVSRPQGPSYFSLFAEHLLRLMKENPRVSLLTAGTPSAIGFVPELRAEAGDRFIDVGICEQDAVATAAGMARGGMRPVFGVMATFVQRAYDQISQEVAINQLPVVIVTFNGGAFGIPDETHLGWFDVPMISNIPGVLMLAPTSPKEFINMIDWAIGQTEGPVVVRCPTFPFDVPDEPWPADFDPDKYVVTHRGERVALIGEGGFYHRAVDAAAILRGKGLNPTVIKPIILSGVDAETLDTLRDYDLVMTFDDSSIDGSMGQKIAAYLSKYPVRVVCKGLPKEFLNDYSAPELMKQLGLEPTQIADEVLSILTR